MDFGILLFFLWSLSVFFSFRKSADIFSFSKVYSIVFFTFFGEIFWHSDSYQFQVQFICLFLILINFYVVLVEKKIRTIDWSFSFIKRDYNRILRTIWLLSIIPVLAQFYLISQIGGIEAYVSSIAGRVKDWEGLGIYIFLTKFINIFSFIYFIIYIKNSDKKFSKHLLFFFHFSIFLSIALMSGSRSNVLWNLVFMLVFFNYNVKRVTIRKGIIGFGMVLSLAMILGIAREGYEYSSGGISTGLANSKKILEASNFRYGLEPLEKIFEYETIEKPQFGLTFVSAITNLIPRSLWPQKFDTGGVVITREYFKDPYGGYSNYTTGIIAESIINFGFFLGPVIGFFILFLFIQGVVEMQRKINYLAVLYYYGEWHFNQYYKYLALQGGYCFVIFGTASYIYAEFTTNTISLFVFKLILFLLLFKLLKHPIVKGFTSN